MKKSILRSVGLALSVAMLTGGLVGCKAKDSTASTSSTAAPAKAVEVVKPTSIKMTVDTTFILPENGISDITAAYKAQTGIDLQITQPVHNQYYEKLNLQFASGDVPDVLEAAGNNLANFAVNGALWDMSSAIAKSEVLKNVNPKYADAIKINGKSYAYPLQGGGGTINYIRKDLLDKLNLKLPTTYDEYIAMLKAFKTINVIPLSAAGVINTEVPYTIYLREFYQDAQPNFVKVNGKWVDGMTQPNMKAALERMKSAYADGLIDKEIFTNKTSSVRDKFYAGKVGLFNYWAGDWNRQIEINLQKAIPTGTVVAMPAINGVKYIERAPVGLAISSKAKNPEGIFKYLVEYMHDGKDGELLFTDGVKDISWTVKDGVAKKLPSKVDPKIDFPKIYLAPEFSITGFKSAIALDKRVTDSLAIFNKDSVAEPLLPASDILSKSTPDLFTMKNEDISKIVAGTLSVDDGLAKYAKDSKAMVDAILADLNK